MNLFSNSSKDTNGVTGGRLAKRKLALTVAIAVAAILMTGCDSPTNNNNQHQNQTPVASHYTFGNLAQTAGSVTAVTITANAGASPGAVVNIRYNGNTEIPQTAGTFAVTFDVEAAEGWNSATGLSAGNLVVGAAGSVNQTPVASHYTFGNLAQTAGSVTAVTITANAGASPGAVVNIRYNGNTEIPQTAGTFAVTFDVEAAEGWYASTGLSAGNLVVSPVLPTLQPLIWTGVSYTENTFVDSTFASVVNGIAHGSNKWVAVGNNGRIAYSPDGATWTAVTQANSGFTGTPNIITIAYGNGRWVAGGTASTVLDGGRAMRFSDDGITWTAVTNNFGVTINSIAHNGQAGAGSRWVAVGNGGTMVTSTDGMTWTTVTSTVFPVGASAINTVAYSNGRWIAGGIAGPPGSTIGVIARSDNGTVWATANTTAFTAGAGQVRSIAYGNDRWIAVGDSGRMAYSTDNGATWTQVPDSPFDFGFLARVRGITFANNRWVAVGDSGNMAYSANGENWTAVRAANSGISGPINAVAYGNGRWLAGGQTASAPLNGLIAYALDGQQ